MNLKTKSSLITSRSEGKRRSYSSMFVFANKDAHADIGIESDASGALPQTRGMNFIASSSPSHTASSSLNSNWEFPSPSRLVNPPSAQSAPVSSIARTNVATMPGSSQSSESTNITCVVSERRLSSPVLRAKPKPAFSLCTVRTQSFSADRRSHSSPDPSVDPSSTSSISNTEYDCSRMERTHCSR